MSASPQPVRPTTVATIRAAKGRAEPLVALTASTAPIAQLANEVADLILVGDSLGMVLYGFKDTVPVTLDMMILHGRTVSAVANRALVVVDLPFATYQESREVAFRSAARVLKESGAAAVKLEGGVEMADTIAFLVERGIPVLAHIGLLPQSVNAMGGYKVQGKTAESAERVIADAAAVAKAGAFAVVVEGVAESVARRVTEAIAIPTIGIGASATCDGQILVTEDLLGLTPGKKAKFVKLYANLYGDAQGALARYAADVRSRAFPAPEQTYEG